MNKKQFMDELSMYLISVPENEKSDILSDYEEHFTIGVQSGRSEEEISESLGDPKSLAKQILSNYTSNNSSHSSTNTSNQQSKHQNVNYDYNVNSSRSKGNPLPIKILLIIALLLFNITFVLGITMGIVGVIFGLFGSAVGLFFGGVAGVIGSIFKPLLSGIFVVSGHPVTMLLMGITMTGSGILLFIGSCYISKFVFKILKKYVSFNFKIIRGEF